MIINHRAEAIARPLGIYSDHFVPNDPGRHVHVVMVHGGSHTGSCYLMTAEGKSGWAYRFADRGYKVVVPDWPGHGRSGALDLQTLTSEQVCQSLAGVISELDGPVALLTHSMGSAFGWRVAELCRDKIIAIIGAAPAPPGNIQPEPEILAESEGSVTLRTPFRTLTLQNDGATRVTPSFVIDKLVGKSRQFPLEHLDDYTKLLTHTGSRLLYERLNVRGSQVRVQNPLCFRGMPVLIVTGSDDLEHPREVDEQLSTWLKAQGASSEFVWLSDRGIYGNGHMMMMERNSNQIADLILEWLDQITL
ncbi:alpha/beta fold hydrolase [Acidicapsa ligni]|uniref:alpha/beta fold hydrolase n=1 Tax=Acidicapsa ligni TaxID=542300 RepID=UPI0021E0F955|nr:alpha/beta fold hydrolase [Acidicapsa ligni]